MKIPRSMIALLMLTSVAAMSCAASSRQLQLTGSSDIPAAQATAKISTTENGNTKIDLVAHHLAAPDRVNSGATVYVVWARGNDHDAQPVNLGALTVDGNLKGSFTTVTPLRAFDLYVTAEPTQAVTSPSGKTLLNTTVAMR